MTRRALHHFIRIACIAVMIGSYVVGSFASSHFAAFTLGGVLHVVVVLALVVGRDPHPRSLVDLPVARMTRKQRRAWRRERLDVSGALGRAK